LIKSWDYLKEYKKIKRNLLKKIDKTFSSGNLILGPEVEKFEKNFRKFIGAKYGIGVGNCTDAIYIALKSLNIGHGDEVITVSNTAIPTITAIVNAGAKPKFVDIKDNYLIDENKIEKAINKKTKALIVVHLYGLSCNMNFINKIKKKYKIKIIEDCAQSTGATYYKKKTGNIGDVGCFSFYPTKVLGAYGDGGFITTNDKKIFHNLKLKRFMGIENNEKSKNKYNKKYYAITQGINSRLDEVQAGILNYKIKFLKKNIKIRNEIAKFYSNQLKDTSLFLPKSQKNCEHVFYQYVVSHSKRDIILKKLKKNKIELKITYPYPVHTMPPYKKYINKKGQLKKTEYYKNKIFSLPTYPEITRIELKKIVFCLKNLTKQYE
jgi:aminotransferase EvaB